MKTQKSNSQDSNMQNNNQSFWSLVKTFFKENRKKIIWLAVVAVVTWFTLELVSNWAAFTEGFHEGLNK